MSNQDIHSPGVHSAAEQILPLNVDFDRQIIEFVQLLEPQLDASLLQARVGAMRAQSAEFIGVFDAGLVQALLGIAAVSIRTHCFSGKVAYVENVVFLPEARQRGLGELLMNWLENYGKNHACSMITLDAYHRNTRARTFYERLGYDPRGVHFVKSL